MKQWLTRENIQAFPIKSKDMSVAEIAYTVGIENPHYFSRIFSERMGVSCTEYRKRMRND